MSELKNVFFDIKTFRKFILTSCRLFADKDDRYTIDIRNIYDRYTLYIHYVTIMVQVWLTNPTFHIQIIYYPLKNHNLFFEL